jgi:hypothetical protein
LDVTKIISEANGSAAALVNLLAEKFPAFRDEAKFERKKVRFLKRAQIFVADVWSAFDGEGYGKFQDIDHLTMFPGKHFKSLCDLDLTLFVRLSCITAAQRLWCYNLLSAIGYTNQKRFGYSSRSFLGGSNPRLFDMVRGADTETDP